VSASQRSFGEPVSVCSENRHKILFVSNTHRIEHFPSSCVWLIQNKGEQKDIKVRLHHEHGACKDSSQRV